MGRKKRKSKPSYDDFPDPKTAAESSIVTFLNWADWKICFEKYCQFIEELSIHRTAVLSHLTVNCPSAFNGAKFSTLLVTAVKSKKNAFLRACANMIVCLNELSGNNIDDEEGVYCTALHAAVQGANIEIIKLLVSCSASVNVEDAAGYSAIGHAIEALNHDGMRKCVEGELEDFPFKERTADVLEVVDTLIGLGGNINHLASGQKLSLFHWGISHFFTLFKDTCNEKVPKEMDWSSLLVGLIHRGADPFQCGGCGDTPWDMINDFANGLVVDEYAPEVKILYCKQLDDMKRVVWSSMVHGSIKNGHDKFVGMFNVAPISKKIKWWYQFITESVITNDKLRHPLLLHIVTACKLPDDFISASKIIDTLTNFCHRRKRIRLDFTVAEPNTGLNVLHYALHSGDIALAKKILRTSLLKHHPRTAERDPPQPSSSSARLSIRKNFSSSRGSSAVTTPIANGWPPDVYAKPPNDEEVVDLNLSESSSSSVSSSQSSEQAGLSVWLSLLPKDCGDDATMNDVSPTSSTCHSPSSSGQISDTEFVGLQEDGEKKVEELSEEDQVEEEQRSDVWNSTSSATIAQFETGKAPLLHFAMGSVKNTKEVLSLLLEFKADVNQIDGFGMSPLHLAVTLGQLELVKFLLERPKIVKSCDLTIPSTGDSLMHAAVRNLEAKHLITQNTEAIFRLMVDRGISIYSPLNKHCFRPSGLTLNNSADKVLRTVVKERLKSLRKKRKHSELSEPEATEFRLLSRAEKYQDILKKPQEGLTWAEKQLVEFEKIYVEQQKRSCRIAELEKLRKQMMKNRKESRLRQKRVEGETGEIQSRQSNLETTALWHPAVNGKSEVEDELDVAVGTKRRRDELNVDFDANQIREEKELKDVVLVEDLSHGTEPFPIRVVSRGYLSNPPQLHYITENIDCVDGVVNEVDYKRSCNCEGNCWDNPDCTCFANYKERLEVDGSELNRTIPLNKWDEQFVDPHTKRKTNTARMFCYCSMACSCRPECVNRRPKMTHRIEIFDHRTKGWCVRAVDTIPASTFITEYFGQYFSSNEQYEEREAREYDETSVNYRYGVFGDLDVNARYFGNVARFIAHSCDPNAKTFVAWDNHKPGSAFYRVVVYSVCLIKAGTEVTVNYGYKHKTSPSAQLVTCDCGGFGCQLSFV